MSCFTRRLANSFFESRKSDAETENKILSRLANGERKAIYNVWDLGMDGIVVEQLFM